MPAKISGRRRKRAPKPACSSAAAFRAEVEKADKYIAEQLKALYDSVVVEPVPDRLLHLLDRLDDAAEK
jgi:hypothetical protein